MSAERYRISNSRAVSEQLRALVAKAESNGIHLAVVRALRWMLEELERTPLEFGESREGSDVDRLRLRIGFAEPLVVNFGVHEPSRNVFVSRIGLSKRQK